MIVHCNVNGQEVAFDTDPTTPLLELLRRDLELRGARPGCRKGLCGSCSVLLNGHLSPSCLVPAFQAEATNITTIEGFVDTPEFGDIERAFERAGVTPCRFCVGGKILATHGLISTVETPLPTDIERALTGIWCRCTGYSSLVKGIQLAAEFRRRRLRARRS